MRELLSEVTDLVLPRRCVGCSAAGALLCPLCAPTGPPFAVAGDGLEVRSAAVYDDGMRRAVLAYKERGRRDLGPPLARLLAAAVRALDGDRSDVVLVAPPSTRAVAAQRGGDHMQRLARRVARELGLRAAPGTLRATRRVRDSAGLSIGERERNLHGSLLARPPSRRCAVVVDDVVTTGATLREANRALRAAGWTVLGAAVVCATPRRFPASPLAAPSGSV